MQNPTPIPTDLSKEWKKALKTVAPNLIVSDDANWQQLKSAQTREALLQSTLECLAEVGYARTTTQLVTDRAKISRGSMLHHFKSKQELINQAIEYTLLKRIMRFYHDIQQLTVEERIVEIAGLEIYWKTMRTPEYEAYIELAMASRTNEEVRNIFELQDRKFQEFWQSQLPKLFPEWENKKQELQLARDLVLTSMQGLFMNMHVIDEKRRRVQLRKLLISITSLIINGELKLPDVSKTDIKNMKE